MSKRSSHFSSMSFYGNRLKLRKFSLTEAVRLVEDDGWDGQQNGCPGPVTLQPLKQSLHPSNTDSSSVFGCSWNYQEPSPSVSSTEDFEEFDDDGNDPSYQTGSDAETESDADEVLRPAGRFNRKEGVQEGYGKFRSGSEIAALNSYCQSSIHSPVRSASTLSTPSSDSPALTSSEGSRNETTRTSSQESRNETTITSSQESSNETTITSSQESRNETTITSSQESSNETTFTSSQGSSNSNESNETTITSSQGSSDQTTLTFSEGSSDESSEPAKKKQSLNIQTTGKRYVCIFCKKYLAQHLNRHLLTAHATEQQIMDIKELRGAERQEALLKLRNKGRDLHNQNVLAGTVQGGLIVERKGNSSDPALYRKCTMCKALYHKSSFGRHRCTDKVGKMKGQPVVELQLLDEEDTNVVQAINGLQDSTNRCIVKGDALLRMFSRRYCTKHAMRLGEFQPLRHSLNVLAKLLACFRKMNDNDTASTADMLRPACFDMVVAAAKEVAGYSSTGHIRAPSTVGTIGRLLSECAETHQALELKAGRSGQEAATFQRLLETEWNVDLGHAAALQLKEQKRNKIKDVPLTTDIHRYCDHLKAEIEACVTEMKEKVTPALWRKLAETTLAYLITFNRRRPTEMSAMTLEDYSQLRIGIDSHAKELDLTECEQFLLKSLARVELRGKRTRPVPVLLTPKIQAALELLFKYREKAMVSSQNPFVFALNNKDSEGYIRGCDALRSTVERCSQKLKHPERLRCTNLRKEIATAAQVLTLSDNDFESICKWLGHSEAVHLRHYRQSFIGHEVTKMAPLLFALEEGTVPKQKGKCLSQVTFDRENAQTTSDVVMTPETALQEDVLTETTVKESCSYTKFSSEAECALRRNFQAAILGGKLPGKREILKVAEREPSLSNRSWLQLKHKVAYERKKHRKHLE